MSDWVGIFIILVSLFYGGVALGIKCGEPMLDSSKALSSADVVEVVRCEDCKYFDSGTDEDGKLFFKCIGWVYGETRKDDFCSHGERKDE